MTLPLHTYIAAVEAITPLPESEKGFAEQAWRGGIPPDRFARWLQILASPSIAPRGLPSPQDGASAPSRLPVAGRGNELEKEIA